MLLPSDEAVFLYRGLPVEEDTFETLNGLLVFLLDKVPTDGVCETIHTHGYIFEIQRVEDRIIREVRITKCTPSDKDDVLVDNDET